MELHQIRYFLALANVLNFTAAAEACNVSQPALSRAISQLEGELGGELFRRERKLTHLTDLGRTVLPSLQDCYRSTVTAKELALSFHKAGRSTLSVALSRTIGIDRLSPMLSELSNAFPNIEIKMIRGSADEIATRLRNGDTEVAIAGPLTDEWDRIEARKLFEQQFGLLLNPNHKFATQSYIEVADLAAENLLARPNCVITESLNAKLKELGVPGITRHEINEIDDVPALVQANFGIGVWPFDRTFDGDLQVAHISMFPMNRWIQVYSVFGRPQSLAAKTLIGLLRCCDWTANDHPPPQVKELVA